MSETPNRGEPRDASSLEDAIEEMESQYDPSADETQTSSADVAADRVAELEAQLAAGRKRELQAQAELDNFRKRLIRDSEQQLKFATLPLLRDLLDVADNLARAIEAASGPSAAAENSSLLEGVHMVQRQFLAALAKHHCEPIQSLGQPFDPNNHEAISQSPSDSYEAGIVMYEAARGYKLYDRVIRPAQVIVSSGRPTAG